MSTDCLLDEKMDGRTDGRGMGGWSDRITRSGRGLVTAEPSKEEKVILSVTPGVCALRSAHFPGLSLPGRADSMPRKEVEPVELPRQPEV